MTSGAASVGTSSRFNYVLVLWATDDFGAWMLHESVCEHVCAFVTGKILSFIRVLDAYGYL